MLERGLEAARARAQRFPARHLSRAEDPRGRIDPAERVLGNAQYRREMQGLDVPGGIYAHIAGVDIVRAGEGEWYVLEDNLRVPSGVSYMLENRKMMMRLLPELFAHAVDPRRCSTTRTCCSKTCARWRRRARKRRRSRC